MKDNNEVRIEVTKQVTDSDKAVAEKVGVFKLLKACLKIMKRACQDCQVKMNINPRRPVEDYCPRCQEIIKNNLGGLI